MRPTPPTHTFGVPPLDQLLGNIPQGSLLLVENDPGVDGEPFLYQFTHHHLAQGRPVLYCVTNRSPDNVRTGLKEYGFGPQMNGKLHFLDAFSSLFGSRSDAEFHLSKAKDVLGLVELLRQAAQQHPQSVLVIDSLSTLIDRVGPAAFLASFESLRQALRRFRLGVALLTRWPYAEDLSPIAAAFDGIVSIRGVEERVLFSQYFSVERAAWLPKTDPRPLLYKTKKPGGVFVYLPKIVVTGPHHSGKTTFIHSVADTARSSEFRGTTVGMDHGQVTFEGLRTDLFGTPGQERFDPLLKTIAGEALGVIVVVDSTRPETFARAREMLQKTWRQGLPAVIAASKQDLPGAVDPAQLARLIEAPDFAKVIGCVATQRESARAVLKELIDQILHGGTRLGGAP